MEETKDKEEGGGGQQQVMSGLLGVLVGELRPIVAVILGSLFQLQVQMDLV